MTDVPAAGRGPIAFHLFRNALLPIAVEMALAIHRTTHSAVLKDCMDCSTAFRDAQGRPVAPGLTLPSPLGPIPGAPEAAPMAPGSPAAGGAVVHLRPAGDHLHHLRAGRRHRGRRAVRRGRHARLAGDGSVDAADPALGHHAAPRRAVRGARRLHGGASP